MKYSILIAYIDRLPQWQRSCCAWRESIGKRDDCEVVLAIDNAKCTPKQRKDAIAAVAGLPLIVVDLPEQSRHWFNMSSAVNLAAEAATGDALILTHQEIVPPPDVLFWFDVAMDAKPDAYFAAACMGLDENGMFDKWFQHSSLSHDHRFHFCACLARARFWAAGGFDDEMSCGYAVDDLEFLDRLRYAHVPVLAYDTVVVAHQDHSRNYAGVGMDRELQVRLHERNKALLDRNRAQRKAGTWKPQTRPQKNAAVGCTVQQFGVECSEVQRGCN